eukprot:CAMPEP_0195513672 /NCGR_PEP_ID=MMETSP0794_2-20130614/5275_1 /TAXON_ID=515487 /ORGANISM="Stephanopyxis turris, Strain CCMP 815" /LENGTH=59 /DNA_ID=CAMNT_0040641741 /DNA_START=72 /DNA_END=251 /DNA_ORIENTATION=-
MERNVVAKHENTGKYCTEITSPKWLKRPLKIRSNPGLHQVDVPKEDMPDMKPKVWTISG